MAATNFKTENNTYRKLIGNGLTYRIPPFQRDYSWGEEEWEDLWLDLRETLKAGEPAHYMGYLVLQSDDEKAFDVIDGQQRLTTLTLLVLAVLKHLQRQVDAGHDASENQTRIDEFRRIYVGSLDTVTLASRSKLTLNRNNDGYFQQYLIPLQRLPQRRLRASEHALRKGFEFFERRVEEYLAEAGDEPGVVLARLVNDMSDKLFFTVINVTDELNAYRVFETLNARGVKLSATDLLKNYLFSVLDRDRARRDEELPLLEQRWDALVGRLGSELFPEFLRVHWLSTGRFVRQADLFKAVRREVATREAVFQLLQRLDEDLDRYLALREPATSALASRPRELAMQLRLFGVRQPYPLLVAAHRALSEQDFETVLRACVVISFRYNVICGFSPGDQEPVYAEASRALAEGRAPTPSALIRLLSRIYPTDEVFEANFQEKLFTRGKEKLVRHVLCELEHQVSQVKLDADSDTLTVEHVLPTTPGDGWSSFPEPELEAMTFRLANMVLLRRSANVSLGNKSYAEKRPVLAASEFSLTRELAEENADWSPDRLLSRQRRLASLAGARWRVSQLG